MPDTIHAPSSGGSNGDGPEMDFLRKIDEMLFGPDEVEGRSEPTAPKIDEAMNGLRTALRAMDYRTARSLCLQIDRLVVPKAHARER